jgi:hypothetical protein
MAGQRISRLKDRECRRISRTHDVATEEGGAMELLWETFG